MNKPIRAGVQDSIADTIYRRFFLAGIIILLTAGALWGAVNLMIMALKRSFVGGVDYSWLLAHGHAMVFGFVGLFIMGFAYQAFPRLKHTRLWKPELARSTLPLMVTGIMLQIAAHLSAPEAPFITLGVIAGLLQTMGVIVFGLVIFQTIQQAEKPEYFDRFIYAALFWLLAAALASPFIFFLFETASGVRQLVFRVALFNIPYRDIQLFGMAVMMILGVSFRFLPHAYGLRQPSKRWQAFAWWTVNGALVLGITTYLERHLSGRYGMMLGQQAAAVALLVVAVGSIRQYRLFDPVPESRQDRGLKFIRAGYAWFAAAMLMLVLLPVYNFFVYQPLTGAGIPFSHAFFGAYRHALTVGFITMMILGVSVFFPCIDLCQCKVGL